VEDIQELDADHYLTVFRSWLTGGIHFLDETFAGDIAFIEYKGDVFDVMTTIDDYTLSNDVVISPNPVSSGEYISIYGAGQDTMSEIQLVTSAGQLLDIQHTTDNRYRTPVNISSGMYFLRVINEKRVVITTVYIR